MVEILPRVLSLLLLHMFKRIDVLRVTVVLLLLVVLSISGMGSQSKGYVYEEEILYGTFPKDFAWGSATSAYQVEGGWDEGGKSLSIWDTFVNDTTHIADGSDGKVACDSYHKYPEDVKLLKAMGLSHYRFSIAWTRIIPDGVGEVNQEGVDYYRRLLAELKANNITPVATLYHWDLPQALEDLGGWRNSSSADWFKEYAVACFQAFGDEVKQWITINEPWVVSIEGYGVGDHAPGLRGIGTLVYETSHNLIRAHAKAYRAYHKDFAQKQRGKIGITLNVNWAQPRDPANPDDKEASDTHLQFSFGWFARPILLDGKYPDVMRQKIDAKSKTQGLPKSRLPEFSPEDAEEIAGTSDFLGINFYTASIVTPKEAPDDYDINYFADSDIHSYQDETWHSSGSSWLKVTPFGIRPLLNWVRQKFGNHQILITENGVSDRLGHIDDLHRIYYFKHYINQILKAVKLDGVDVAGYFAWSLLDNFEWHRGYLEKFGIHRVDFDDPDRPRTPKASSKYLAGIVADNGFLAARDQCSQE